MAKFNSKLSREEVKKIFYQLCVAISEIKNIEEAAELLRDLLSYQEAQMIAKRLKIAELLLDGMTYDEIQEKLKVSASTIARVQEWLKISGEGYNKAAKRIKGKEPKKFSSNYNPEEWNSLKRRYPMYYWPQILLENIIRESNMKQKKKIERVISQMDKIKEKNELFLRLKKLVSQSGFP